MAVFENNKSNECCYLNVFFNNKEMCSYRYIIVNKFYLSINVYYNFIPLLHNFNISFLERETYI